MAKYLYCIVKEDGNFNYNNLVGIEGVPIQPISHQGLFCISSETNLGDKELNRESALAHEKVLEEIMKDSPIVPIAFGHVVKSEDEVKTKLLEPYKSKLEEYLNYLEGKAELSLKALWLDLNSVLAKIAQESNEIKKIKVQGKLTRDDQIRAGEIAVELLGKKREEIEKEIIKYLNDIALEYKKCNLFGDQMITNLAFLIKADDLDRFDKRINEYAENLGNENIKLKYTGPVPPYNFVEFKINLK